MLTKTRLTRKKRRRVPQEGKGAPVDINKTLSLCMGNLAKDISRLTEAMLVVWDELERLNAPPTSDPDEEDE